MVFPRKQIYPAFQRGKQSVVLENVVLVTPVTKNTGGESENTKHLG